MIKAKTGNPGTLRERALATITQVENGAHIQDALDKTLSAYDFSSREKQFCTDLVYGYFRHKISLLYVLSRILPKPGKLPLPMRAIIVMGIYSMLFQNSVPDYAAIHETVELVKKLFGNVLGRVANGAMRNAQRLRTEMTREDWYCQESGDSWSGKCIFYGIPAVVGNMWRNEYGITNAICLLKRCAARPWIGLRINPLHIDAGDLNGAFEAMGAYKIGKYGFAFAPGEAPDTILGQDLIALQAAGAISCQSPASMLVMEKLGLYSWQKPVWDACAGSGIKCAALLERRVEVGLACDLSGKRLKNIAKFCARLNLPPPPAVMANAAQPPVAKWAGNIIADVPCTGLGMLARRPDIRIRLKTDTQFWAEAVNTQKKILAGLFECLKADNELAYITCTLNPQENEKLIRAFSRQRRDAKIVTEWQTPHDHPWLEGMYGAVIKKI